MRENEEIVDVLDECGEIVDRTSVANAHQNGLKHRVVAVFVVLDGNELILQTRADNGLLDFSVLGHVRAGEEASVAAKREMREELDLAGEPKFVCEYENKPSPRGHLWGIFFWNCSSPLVFYPTAEVSEIILVNGGDLTRRIKERRETFATGFLKAVERLHAEAAASENTEFSRWWQKFF